MPCDTRESRKPAHTAKSIDDHSLGRAHKASAKRFRKLRASIEICAFLAKYHLTVACFSSGFCFDIFR